MVEVLFVFQTTQLILGFVKSSMDVLVPLVKPDTQSGSVNFENEFGDLVVSWIAVHNGAFSRDVVNRKLNSSAYEFRLPEFILNPDHKDLKEHNQSFGLIRNQMIQVQGEAFAGDQIAGGNLNPAAQDSKSRLVGEYPDWGIIVGG